MKLGSYKNIQRHEGVRRAYALACYTQMLPKVHNHHCVYTIDSQDAAQMARLAYEFADIMIEEDWRQSYPEEAKKRWDEE